MTWHDLFEYLAWAYVVCVLIRYAVLLVQWHYGDGGEDWDAIAEAEAAAERDLRDRMAVGAEEWLP
jgi:hypothetical protein